jgi:hypothetical protein
MTLLLHAGTRVTLHDQSRYGIDWQGWAETSLHYPATVLTQDKQKKQVSKKQKKQVCRLPVVVKSKSPTMTKQQSREWDFFHERCRECKPAMVCLTSNV